MFNQITGAIHEASHEYPIHINADDKAYIRPETSATSNIIYIEGFPDCSMKCNLVCVTISLFTVVLNVYFIFIYHYFFWPVGMAGTKHQSLFQPTEESGLLTRALPSHDLCDSCLYVTPSGYRFMSHEVKEIDVKLMNYKLNMFVGRD